ncbi:DUF885 domain-containing protein [Candidatus Fermentibacteria bacterium]|nr:DUF885 domain-containing protein [Candidatus Fermentibacteria bacterium]
MNETQRLHGLFEREWEAWMARYPTWASSLGDRRFNDRWDDLRPEAIEAWNARIEAVIRELDSFDSASLSAEDLLNRDLLRLHYANDAEEHRRGLHCLVLNQRHGPQTADELGSYLRFETVKDFEDWIGRVRAVPAYLAQAQELLAEGVRRRIVHPRVIMERVPRQLDAQIVVNPTESPFFRPFNTLPECIAAEHRENLASEARAAIETGIVPAFARFREFFVEEYLPGCFSEVGIWQMPDGNETYRFLVREHTTRDLSPDEVHDIGLAEVARIKAQMHEVMRQTGFTGSLGGFFAFLRTDPRFYYACPEELLAGYRSLCKRIDPCLVKLFGVLPRMPYGVEPIPDTIAPDTTTAYYSRPATDGSRAGTYYVNVYRPETRPRYEMVPLSLHEAVPGHHLQISLAMEGNLPRFRRHLAYHAYTEGWALYAERLGEEMGLYEDPYDRFGRLSFAMWRAARLVIDTGIHWKRWTRTQGISFLRDHTPKSELDITNEVDRYIAWPGQALSYAIGEITMRELRQQAEETLGSSFDLRAFHDTVLSTGAVPLDALSRHVKRWMDGRDGGRADGLPESGNDTR